jgi:hypothetical protein
MTSDDNDDQPIGALLDAPMTEVARAISELGPFAGQLIPEQQALAKVFKTYLSMVNAMRGTDRYVVGEGLCQVIGLFALNMMMGQHRLDRQLFAQSQPPFRTLET